MSRPARISIPETLCVRAMSGLVWLTLFGWSLWRIPVPGVNEPHYLGKARHWWNPEWCPGDMFLDSTNVHLVFYATLGGFTQLFPLPAAAIIGRGLGLLILACGWQKLCCAVTGRAWSGLLALPVLLTLQTLGNFSGEWLIGGIEAKVPAYGFLFWSLGSALSGQFAVAGLVAGLSVSFHPLVGLWGVICSVLATGIQRILFHERQPGTTETEQIEAESLPPRQSPAIASGLLMIILFVLAALPGLLPALSILQSSDPQLDVIATRLQVGDRLAHHLDPMKFSKESYRYWGMMILVWLLVEAKIPPAPQRRWWTLFVLTAVGIAITGVVIGWGPRPLSAMPGYEWRMRLLKFYFFRLGDQLVPIALSLSVAQLALQQLESTHRNRSLVWGWGAGFLACVAGALWIPFPDQNPSRLTAAEHRDWEAACVWLKQNTAADELVYTTDSNWSVKWYADRPEYVNFKDMPQDAASIVEWNRRLWVIADWRAAATQDGLVTEEELSDLRHQTGISVMISKRFGPIDSEPAFSNEAFRVYRLPE